MEEHTWSETGRGILLSVSTSVPSAKKDLFWSVIPWNKGRRTSFTGRKKKHWGFTTVAGSEKRGRTALSSRTNFLLTSLIFPVLTEVSSKWQCALHNDLLNIAYLDSQQSYPLKQSYLLNLINRKTSQRN